MALETHLVVTYNHDTKQFTFDGDGSREWIRFLFDPETNTWSDEEEDYVPVASKYDEEAVEALRALGVNFDITAHGWQTR